MTTSMFHIAVNLFQYVQTRIAQHFHCYLPGEKLLCYSAISVLLSWTDWPNASTTAFLEVYSDCKGVSNPAQPHPTGAHHVFDGRKTAIKAEKPHYLSQASLPNQRERERLSEKGGKGLGCYWKQKLKKILEVRYQCQDSHLFIFLYFWGFFYLVCCGNSNPDSCTPCKMLAC